MRSTLNPPPNGPSTGPYATPRPFSAQSTKLQVPMKVIYKAFETLDEPRRELKGNES